MPPEIEEKTLPDNIINPSSSCVVWRRYQRYSSDGLSLWVVNLVDALVDWISYQMTSKFIDVDIVWFFEYGMFAFAVKSHPDDLVMQCHIPCFLWTESYRSFLKREFPNLLYERYSIMWVDSSENEGIAVLSPAKLRGDAELGHYVAPRCAIHPDFITYSVLHGEAMVIPITEIADVVRLLNLPIV